MEKISSKELLAVVESASEVADRVIDRVTTDSRQAVDGALFVAVRGENFDGHDFVGQALDKGAALALVERPLSGVPLDRQVVVKNTLDAYGKIGAYNRSKFRGTVIGLTGSAGKTTTKEEIKFALSRFGRVYATSGNHNNHIGVPMSLCEMDMNADYAVIEMGMSAKGEIARLTSYVQPDVALVTNVYPMHIEFFENFAGIAEAKAEIFEGLKKGGVALINEDTHFADILEQRALEHAARVVKFGRSHHYAGKLTLEQEGEAQLYNAWATLAVVEALGLEVDKAAAALKDFGALPGRGKTHRLKLPSGGAFTLIDDSYSGQPEAMMLAIDGLDKQVCAGRKIVVLGKMAELGQTAEARHKEIGKRLSATSIAVAVGVCPDMRTMLAELRPDQEKHYFEDKQGVVEFLLNNLLQNNDILLIKGARYSSKLYQVTDALLKGLEKA